MISKESKITIGTAVALVAALFSAIAYMDARHVGIDAYAADNDQVYRRDLQQDVNFYQMQKSVLYTQRRAAPPEDKVVIDDEIQEVNEQLKQSQQQLQELQQ